jgi:hypothetical protein
MNNESKPPTLSLGPITYTAPAGVPKMKSANDFLEWHKQAQEKLLLKQRMNTLSNMQHGAIPGAAGGGGAAAAAPVTREMQDAAIYGRLEGEYQGLLMRISAGEQLNAATMERLHMLPSIMMQYAPPTPPPVGVAASAAAALPPLVAAAAGGAGAAASGNLPSPGGYEAFMAAEQAKGAKGGRRRRGGKARARTQRKRKQSRRSHRR